MDQGWIKIHRRLLSSPAWQQSTPEQKTILVTCLLKANHSANKWEWGGKTFTVKPGEFVTSIDSLAASAGKGISRQNVRTALKRFQSLGFLTYRSTKYGRIITICNWDKYQQNKNGANTPANSYLTKPSHSANKAPTPNKNEKTKECKNESVRPADQDTINSFQLTEGLIQWAEQNGYKNVDLKKFTEHFIEANKAKNYGYTNFQAAWKMWLSKDWEKFEKVKIPKPFRSDDPEMMAERFAND